MASNDDKRKRQERAEQMRREREKAERRRRSGITIGIVVVVLVLIVGTVFAYRYYSDQNSAPAASPTSLTSDGGIVYDQAAAGGSGGPSDPVSVVTYEDFQCPVCKQFEDALGDSLQQQVQSGAITVEYRPIAILDRPNNDMYSTRSAAAAACVADDAGAKAFYDFHQLLYDNQPDEAAGSGLPENQLTSYAKQVGADGAVACIKSGTYEDWAGETTSAATGNGVTGTPTVLVNGKTTEPAQLQAAIAAAAK